MNDAYNIKRGKLPTAGVANMKTGEIVQWILSVVLTLALAGGAFIMNGIKDDISNIRQDIKNGVASLGDFKVDITKGVDKVDADLGRTNQKLDDLIENLKKKRQ